MKYLKTYENKEEYNIGDHILLNMEQLKKSRHFKDYKITDDMAIITGINIHGKNNKIESEEYFIDFPDGYNEHCTFLLDNEIERLLTPKEIDKFKEKKELIEIKNTSNKFNL